MFPRTDQIKLAHGALQESICSMLMIVRYLSRIESTMSFISYDIGYIRKQIYLFACRNRDKL